MLYLFIVARVEHIPGPRFPGIPFPGTQISRDSRESRDKWLSSILTILKLNFLIKVAVHPLRVLALDIKSLINENNKRLTKVRTKDHVFLRIPTRLMLEKSFKVFKNEVSKTQAMRGPANLSLSRDHTLVAKPPPDRERSLCLWLDWHGFCQEKCFVNTKYLV